ncbi:MAG: hypothetical protein KGJ61_10405, partial [Candidatus Omnitrophica bacterium]|nr:hypothetical protein [Candidatus Omnitrophota bacterium]
NLYLVNNSGTKQWVLFVNYSNSETCTYTAAYSGSPAFPLVFSNPVPGGTPDNWPATITVSIVGTPLVVSLGTDQTVNTPYQVVRLQPCCNPFDSGPISLKTAQGSITIDLTECGSGSGSGSGGGCGCTGGAPANLCFSVNGVTQGTCPTNPNGNLSLPFVGTVSGTCVYGNATISGGGIQSTGGWLALLANGALQVEFWDNAGQATVYTITGFNCSFPANLSYSAGTQPCGSNWPATITVNSC